MVFDPLLEETQQTPGGPQPPQSGQAQASPLPGDAQPVPSVPSPNPQRAAPVPTGELGGAPAPTGFDPAAPAPEGGLQDLTAPQPEAPQPHPLDDAITRLQQRLREEQTPGEQVLGPSITEFPKGDLPPGTAVLENSPEVDESPGIFGKMMGRLFGTDVDDPMPWGRMGTTIGGGLAGGYLGLSMPGGPVVKGIAGTAGSIIGTAGGALAPETTMDVLEKMGILEAGTRDKLGLSSEKLTTVLEGEVLLDIATMGGVSLARLTGRGITGIMTGANATSRGLAETATREGIALLPVQVGEGRFARGYTAVMGRFPFLSGPLRRNAQASMDQIQRAFDGIPARLGPVASFDEVGGNILREAHNTADTISRTYGQNFNTLAGRADAMGVTVRPVHTRTVTDRLVRRMTQETPRGLTGQRLAVSKNAQDVRNFVMRTTRLLTDIDPATGRSGTQIADQSLRQMNTMLDTIDAKLVSYAKSGDAVAVERLESLRQAVQMDMTTNLLGPGGRSTPEVRAIAAEMRNMSQEMTEQVNWLFQNATARRLGATLSPTRRAVRMTDNPGGADAVARMITSSSSPDMIGELARIVEPRTMQQLGNAVFNKALDDSFIEVGEAGRIFDSERFAKNLGLNAPTSQKFRQTERLLQETGGLTMGQLQDFVEIARRASSAEIPNVSTMIARRATLSGIDGVVKAFLPLAAVSGAGTAGGGYGVGLVGGALTIGGSRLLGSMISNPQSARALRMVLNEEVRTSVRRAAWIRATSYGVHNLLGSGAVNQEQAEDLMNNMRTYADRFDKAFQSEYNQ